ncbi:MAG: IS6 family transposase [Thaumarchaeota archaeon]|nr:IS6 family transposase [Nitrososphaerota archaeon]MCL5319025.1 IS6 family transposase [Nitrososphaerota archaeon]
MQTCKYCQSTNVVKHAKRGNVQRYLCKACNHHFLDNNVNFPRMRVNDHVIVTALNLYYGGLSTYKVAEQLSDIFGENVSHVTVLNWVQKYSVMVAEYVKTLKPETSGKIHHDETVVKIDKDNKWFWEAIDEETRFLVASHLSNSRTLVETTQQFKKIKEGCNPQPSVIFVDGSNTYDQAFEFAFGNPNKVGRPELVKRVGIRARETNNMVERVHGTLKDRLRPARGLKHNDTAKTWLDGYVINYNYCRTHKAIGQTPAQAAGIKVKGWKQLIQNAQASQCEEESKSQQIIEVKVSN